MLLGAVLLAACVAPRAALAWDVRCVPEGEPPNVECPDPFANARTPWRNHPLAEHRLLLVESLDMAGLPSSLQGEFSLTVYAGSETFEAAGGEYESVRPVRTGAALEQTRTLSVPMMANLPDFSYTLWDWASGNEVCPPDPGHPALDCHNYESHIGWLNSNHMLPQARRWYGYLHSLAVERAGDCKDLAEALEGPDATRFRDWLLACEKEAMAIEAVGQHYLQDAWAIGHMMERWGSTEPADFSFDRGLGFLVSGFVGAIHGSKAMLDEDPIFGPQGPWDDPMNAPHADVGYIDGLDLPLPRPGVGDRFLPQLLGFLPGLDDYAAQREALFGCAVDGLREVYAETAQLHGALEAPGAGFDSRRQVEDDSCWAQRVTNLAFETGIGVHKGAFDGPAIPLIPGVVGWTLSDILGFFLLDAPVTTPEVRERFQTDAGYTATLAALRGQFSPDGTEMAAGGAPSLAGIGPNSQYARGGPGEPPSAYSDPLLPWGLSDPDPQVEERKQALNLTFADAHAADRCGDLTQADLDAYVEAARAAAAGGDPELEQASCGQCVQMVAPHLRFGVEGNHDASREAFCALAPETPFAPAFLYTEEDPGTFTGTEDASLDALLEAAEVRCGCGDVTVSIDPVAVALPPGGTQQFSAQVFGATDTSVTWTAVNGTVTPDGFFTGGSVPGNALVRATSVARPDVFADAIVTISSGAGVVTKTSSRSVVAANGGEPAVEGDCLLRPSIVSPAGATEWSDDFSCTYRDGSGDLQRASATASFTESFAGSDLVAVTASGSGSGIGSATYQLQFSVAQTTTATLDATLMGPTGRSNVGLNFVQVTPIVVDHVRSGVEGAIHETLVLDPGNHGLQIFVAGFEPGLSTSFDLALTFGP
jgi:hypothetical protein